MQDSEVSSIADGWGKSAYMLVYERKTKSKIREVNVETKEVSTVEWKQIPFTVPDWIKSMVKQDNIEFVIDR